MWPRINVNIHCKHFLLIKVNRRLINVNHKLECWSMLFHLDQCCSILIKWYIWRACNKRMLINRCTLINVGWYIDADWGSSVDQGKLVNFKSGLNSHRAPFFLICFITLSMFAPGYQGHLAKHYYGVFLLTYLLTLWGLVLDGPWWKLKDKKNHQKILISTEDIPLWSLWLSTDFLSIFCQWSTDSYMKVQEVDYQWEHFCICFSTKL